MQFSSNDSNFYIARKYADLVIIIIVVVIEFHSLRNLKQASRSETTMYSPKCGTLIASYALWEVAAPRIRVSCQLKVCPVSMQCSASCHLTELRAKHSFGLTVIFFIISRNCAKLSIEYGDLAIEGLGKTCGRFDQGDNYA